jgi:membrane-bound lytic murein transglycosylase F
MKPSRFLRAGAALVLSSAVSCAHPGGPGQANADVNSNRAPPQSDLPTEGNSQSGAQPFSTPSQPQHKPKVLEGADAGAPTGALPSSGSNELPDGGLDEGMISATQGQGVGAGGMSAPPPPTDADKQLAQDEAGEGNEDAVGAEGLDSRASGKPDHARTLEEIKASGYIRVLTRNNDTSFFIYRGHRMGFDYELGKRLAQKLGIRVDMVITNDWKDMVPALLRGEGDAIAAEVTVTPERQAEVLFAQPWAQVREVIVWKDGTPAVHSAQELSGKDVSVRKNSSYYETLTALNLQLAKAGKPLVQIKLIPDDTETDTILTAVAKGAYSYTVADDMLAQIHSAYFDNLVVGPPISAERDVAWAVRPKDKKLAAVINDLFHELRKKPDFNIVKKKYFEAERDFKKRGKDEFYASETGTLSPYDPLVIKHSEGYGFDWRLVAAQIYQESRFDPKNKSWVGAQGLFQIMPATAKGLGIIDPTDPEQSIRGGLKYMSQLAAHYSDVADPIERYRFALAAYNSGFGHIDDARHLARVSGRDASVWKNVSPWLLKLADRAVAARARFGFCRGTEPVDYVRHIDERYAGYAQLVPLKKGDKLPPTDKMEKGEKAKGAAN